MVNNYSVANLTSRKSKNGLDLQGLDNAPLYDISLTNCTFDNVSNGNIVKNVRGWLIN